MHTNGTKKVPPPEMQSGDGGVRETQGVGPTNTNYSNIAHRNKSVKKFNFRQIPRIPVKELLDKLPVELRFRKGKWSYRWLIRLSKDGTKWTHTGWQDCAKDYIWGLVQETIGDVPDRIIREYVRRIRCELIRREIEAEGIEAAAATTAEFAVVGTFVELAVESWSRNWQDRAQPYTLVETDLMHAIEEYIWMWDLATKPKAFLNELYTFLDCKATRLYRGKTVAQGWSGTKVQVIYGLVLYENYLQRIYGSGNHRRCR